MNPTRKIFTAVSLLLILMLQVQSGIAQSDGPAPTSGFLRFVPGDGQFAGELQTALTTYRNADGVEVDLVATVHLADRAYYEGLNAYFTTRDRVLYELVADEDVRPDGRGGTGGSGVIGFLQTSMTRLLGLSYQLDVVNYARPNFVHGDLEPAELDAVMEAKGETLFSSFLALILAEMETREQGALTAGQSQPDLSLTDLLRLFSLPNRQEAFKFLLGQSLAASEVSLAAITGRGITILDDRNAAALDALNEALRVPEVSRISIFYGAAHMPGLEQGLAALGFAPVSRSWLTAWKSG